MLANDHALARLFAKLEEDGWGRNLVFVLTSDHGEEFFEHGATSHGSSLYEEMLRVPLLIHAPGMFPEGRRVRTPVQTIDIYPTLLEVLGIEEPPGLRGTSLVPLIRGTAEPEPRPVFAEYNTDPHRRDAGNGTPTRNGAFFQRT